MKRTILTIAFGIWVILWVFFITRELFQKGCFYNYKVLLSRSLEGKRSYVTGDRLYEFLTFCKSELPAGSSFRLISAEDDSLDRRRAVYYLYPLMEKEEAEFMLVYDSPNMEQAGYASFAMLDNKRHILSRDKKR